MAVLQDSANRRHKSLTDAVATHSAQWSTDICRTLGGANEAVMIRVLIPVVLCLGVGGCCGHPEHAEATSSSGPRSESRPCCASPDIVPVLYGMLGAHGIALVGLGEAVHGGCYLGLGPNRYCRGCGHELFDPPGPAQAALAAEFAARSAELRERLGTGGQVLQLQEAIRRVSSGRGSPN
jgi:hypothetical protein